MFLVSFEEEVDMSGTVEVVVCLDKVEVGGVVKYK